MIPDRAGNVENWELDKLVVILLRQFKRLLDARQVNLTDDQMQAIGARVASGAVPDDLMRAICDALAAIIAESETVLAGWGLTFARSLATDMNAMPGWETTADFLDIANEKVNAEIRISAGAALMLLLGDRRYARYPLQAAAHDLAVQGWLDVDAMLGRRALLYASGVSADAKDWFDRVSAWVDAGAA